MTYSDVYNILMFISILSLIYIFVLVFRRIDENKRYDKRLGVSTTGVRSWDNSKVYNRTESTPYSALRSLVKEYKVNSDDSIVDFGSGKGRVAIFLHNKYRVAVTGIEANELTYDEAVENVKSYCDKFSYIDHELKVEKEYAEEYAIKERENKFFFFNPFDVSIFEKVIDNIVVNSNDLNKEVEVILYFPIDEYVAYLEEAKFTLIKKIKFPGSIGPREKFLIYRFNPSSWLL